MSKQNDTSSAPRFPAVTDEQARAIRARYRALMCSRGGPESLDLRDAINEVMGSQPSEPASDLLTPLQRSRVERARKLCVGNSLGGDVLSEVIGIVDAIAPPPSGCGLYIRGKHVYFERCRIEERDGRIFVSPNPDAGKPAIEWTTETAAELGIRVKPFPGLTEDVPTNWELVAKAEQQRADDLRDHAEEIEKGLAGARDRLATIVDEAFGTHPVMPMDELLSTLEREIAAARLDRDGRLAEASDELAEARATIERLQARLDDVAYAIHRDDIGEGPELPLEPDALLAEKP